MNIIETSIPGVKIIEPQVFGDARGWFVEQYNAERYKGRLCPETQPCKGQRCYRSHSYRPCQAHER